MYGGGPNNPFREEENEPSGNFGSGNQFFSRAEGGIVGGDGNGLAGLNNLEIEQKMGLSQYQQQVDSHLLPQEQRDKMRYGGNYLNIKEDK